MLTRSPAPPRVTTALVLALAAGCTSAPEPAPAPEVARPSRAATSLVDNARSNFGRALSVNLPADELRQTLRTTVISPLEDAARNDPKNPLPHSLAALVLLWAALDEADLRAAEEHFAAAYSLCPEWTPSWTGWAAIALFRGQMAANAGDRAAERRQYEVALQCAAGARWSVEALDSWKTSPGERPPAAFTIPILNITIRPPPRRRDPFDPSLSAEEARRLVFGWLEECLAWRIDNPALTSIGGVDPVTDLLRSLKAAAATAEAQARWSLEISNLAAVPAGPDQDGAIAAARARYDAGLRTALEFDPDWINARLLRAWLCLDSGRYRDAKALLAPYAWSTIPTLLESDFLALLTLRAYTLVYLDGRSRDDLGGLAAFCKNFERRRQMVLDPMLQAVVDHYAARATNDRPRMQEALAALRKTTPRNAFEEQVRAGLDADMSEALSTGLAAGGQP